jgi:hypothetical protein
MAGRTSRCIRLAKALGLPFARRRRSLGDSNRQHTSTTSTLVAPAAERLDLATALKVSEKISGELILERLIDEVLRAAIEHAGAQRGLLIVPRGDELRIEAEATTAGEDVTVYLGRGAGHRLVNQPLDRRSTWRSPVGGSEHTPRRGVPFFAAGHEPAP